MRRLKADGDAERRWLSQRGDVELAEARLYANCRPARSLPGVPSRYEDVDLIVVRKNTKGLYSGLDVRSCGACWRAFGPRDRGGVEPIAKTASKQRGSRVGRE